MLQRAAKGLLGIHATSIENKESPIRKNIKHIHRDQGGSGQEEDDIGTGEEFV